MVAAMDTRSSPPRPRQILPVIVAAQFAGTSLWFAGNAVAADLQREWRLGEGAIGSLTSSVQLGFILGTLVFALFNVADRFPARLVFLASALLGSAANAAIALAAEGATTLLALRFVTGFFLAGIYPVGMKIAASWYEEGLGQALGLLVGAVVLGTAFPHLLKAGGVELPWRAVLLGVSAMSSSGGVLLFMFVPPGPHLRGASAFDPRALMRSFAEPDFRSAAFGYFGHMWELYAFWAFVPALLAAAVARHAGRVLDVSLWSFLVIAMGSLGCVAGGWLSRRWGSARVAAVQLGLSGLCCLLCPLLLALPLPLLLAVLLLWGASVVGDSPQFSALSAMTAPREYVGTALTIVTSIGFAATIPSIQLCTWLVGELGPNRALLILVPGPIFGLLALRRLLRSQVAVEP